MARPPTYPQNNFVVRNDGELRRAIAQIGDLYYTDDPDQTDPNYKILTAIWSYEENRNRPEKTPNGRAFMAFSIHTPGKFHIKQIILNIHSREGARLIYGSAPDPDTGRKKSPGLFQVADKLAVLVNAANDNNPFAVLALVKFEDDLMEIKNLIQSILKDADSMSDYIYGNKKEYNGTFISKSKHTMKISAFGDTIAKSSSSVKSKKIAFRTSYGFLFSGACSSSDYLARKLQALAAAGIITPIERHRVLNLVTKRCRRLAHAVCVMVSQLRPVSIRKITFGDLSAPMKSSSRRNDAITACKIILGSNKFPHDVLTGARRPMYLNTAAAGDNSQALQTVGQALDATIPNNN